MKKITLLFALVFTVISCSESDDVNFLNKNSEHLSKELNKSANCFSIAPPFKAVLNTYGTDQDCFPIYPNMPTLDCFPYRLNILLNKNLNNPAYQISGNTLVTVLNTSYNNINLGGEPYVSFVDLGVPSSIYLYPSIDPIYSNIIFGSVFCEIKDYLNSLPNLPSNQIYFPNITYLGTDFVFGQGPYSQYSNIELVYDVKILVE